MLARNDKDLQNAGLCCLLSDSVFLEDFQKRLFD